MLLLIGGGIFTFLGILVGWNTAKEFGGTPVLGAIAGILIFNPAMANVKLFGEALVPTGRIVCSYFCSVAYGCSGKTSSKSCTKCS